jgi:hypothetical protein
MDGAVALRKSPMFAFLLLALAVRSDFEGGRVGKVEHLSPDHVRCEVPGETDQDKRNRQPSWFYFQVDGAAGRELTVDLVGLEGEYNYRLHDGSGHRNTKPVFSYDNRTWTHFENVEWIAKPATLRLRFHAKGDRVWIARIPPYTTRDLDRLLGEFRKHPDLSEEVIGQTVDGRPLRLLTITNRKVATPAKRVIWLMARQHSWEAGTSWVAEGALRFLLSTDERAVRIREAATFKIIPMADPDGVVRGGVRFNKHGYDLNRNWDVVNAKLMPEIHAQRKAVFDWVDAGNRIDLFLTLHNTESKDYIEGPLSAGGPQVAALGQRFWKLLDQNTAFHSPEGPRDAGATTTPGKPGRMTVNQGLFADRKIPAFLMELMVDSSPKLKRPPTVPDRLEFGAALVRVLYEAVATASEPRASAAKYTR